MTLTDNSFKLYFLSNNVESGIIYNHQDINVLIPRTCYYVTLHDKNYFIDVIKDKDLEMERLVCII